MLSTTPVHASPGGGLVRIVIIAMATVLVATVLEEGGWFNSCHDCL